MKLHSFLILISATLLPAQAPAKPKPTGKPVAASASTVPAATHASLDALERDFQEKKLAALDAYIATHATAADAAPALVEAVDIAKALSRSDDQLRLADLYLKHFADGEAKNTMLMVRADALSNKGDLPGAQKILEDIIEKAGDDVGTLVEATTTLAEMLVANGKKDDAIDLLGVTGKSHSGVRGLEEHFASIAAQYELIGTEPKALGQNDTAGKPIDLSAYKGKIVMLDFWATWCGPCKAELPNVIANYEKFHAKGFEIVGVSLDEDRAAFDKFLSERKMPWRQHFDGNGWKNEIAVLYGVQSIPATYLIGTDGKILAVGLRGEKLGQRLTALLDAPKNTPRK